MTKFTPYTTATQTAFYRQLVCMLYEEFTLQKQSSPVQSSERLAITATGFATLVAVNGRVSRQRLRRVEHFTALLE
jgi:hypothetical protein